MPYITASIIVQLLTVVIPRFEALKKEGQSGTAQAHAVHAVPDDRRWRSCSRRTFVAVARSGQPVPELLAAEEIIPNDSLVTILIMVITMTAGTGLIMWLGELITERGVGNGMSLLIFTSIAAGFPGSLWAIGQDPNAATDVMALVIAIGLVIMALVVFVEQSPAPGPGAVRQADGRPPDVRRLQHLHPDQGQHGRRHPGHLRLVAALPAGADRAVHTRRTGAGRLGGLDQPTPGARRPPVLHRARTSLLIVFFTYFYVVDHVQPGRGRRQHQASTAGSSRASAPAVRPPSTWTTSSTGSPCPGALYLGLVSLIPLIALVLVNANQNFPFGGTSILIVVGVGLETVKQIESQLQQRHYEGFLR